MIGNKHGKVFIIVLINVVAIYFVYSNVTTESSNYLHEQGDDLNRDVQHPVDAFKHEIKTKDPNKKSDSDTTVKMLDPSSIKTEKQAVSKVSVISSESSYVRSMKNVLSIKMKASKVNKTQSVAPQTAQDEELQKKLLDSSEIDLSPPNPVITSAVINILDQDNFHSLMTERAQLLKRKCSNRRSLPAVSSKVMYAMKSKSLVWCPVYKAASTNWMHNLLHLAGKTEDEVKKIIKDHPNQPNDQGRVVAPVTSLSNIRQIAEQEDAKLLLIVRHPFDRLVSAFRDKLEQCHGPQNCTLDNNWYYKQYGKKIVTQYRNEAVRRLGEDFFAEKNYFGSPLPVMRTWRSESLPSWWEFVQYILHTSPSSYDEHWKPASLYCSVCSFPYNYILHFENIQQEEKFFAQEMSASDLIHPRWENRNDEGLAKEEILGKYFNMLDDKDITALYKIYEDDFKMFGYKFEYKHLRLNLKS
eukprot:GFUD01018028.1.p1 GENE.GFUD01018028.1~~GFUD01018028.1.p1  ORF type:complete len:470 (+),score=128.33 GFUD01018028.1:311-1720(+)